MLLLAWCGINIIGALCLSTNAASCVCMLVTDMSRSLASVCMTAATQKLSKAHASTQKSGASGKGLPLQFDQT